MSPLDIGVVGQNIVRNDGQGRAMLELVRALVDRGHAVTVYAHRLDPELETRTRFRRLPAVPGPQAVDDLWLLVRATVAARRAGHDTTVVLGPTALPRGPFAFDAQFSHRGWRRTWTPSTRPPFVHRLHARWTEVLETFVARRAAVIISSTAQVGQDVGGGRTPVVAVPLGIDPAEHPPSTAEQRAAGRARYGLAPTDVVVAFLGGYQTGRKGLDPLLQAVAKGDEHLLVAGAGDAAALQRRGDELGLGGRMHILGFVPAAEVLAAADLAAVPSLYEPFSLVGLEAACMGLPVAIASCAGVAPFLGEAAVTIADAADVAQVRAALDQLQDPGERQRRGAAGPAAARALAWASIIGPAADAVESLVPREEGT